MTGDAPDFGRLGGGLAVGHATDLEGATGLTVIRGIDGPFRCVAALVGRATGTRELHAVSADHVADRADALMLTGGSAYGLDAAAGVMRWMEERGRGHPVSGGVVPIVPAAVVFDLAPLGSFAARPTAAMAYAAADGAVPRGIAEGSVGAGTGATVGKVRGPAGAMKGGVGLGWAEAGALCVGAVAVVNAIGDVRDAGGRIIAGAREPDGAFVDAARGLAEGRLPLRAPRAMAAQQTTLAFVATNAMMSRLELQRLGRAAAAALYRRITPVGTSIDGDVVFAGGPYDGPAGPPMYVEPMAVVALEMAIERAVRTARGRDGIPGLADDA